MNIKVDKKKFETELLKINKALDGNAHLESLKGILIEVNESSINLLASDGNLTIRNKLMKSAELDIIEPGKILIPGKLFIKVIRKLSNSIEIYVEKNSLIIKDENTRATINLLNANDYPRINFEILGKEFKIDSEVLDKAIKNVAFASAEKDNQIIFNGVNLMAKNEKLFISATNKFRLAQESIELNADINFNITMLAKNLKSFLPDNVKGEINVEVSDTKIVTRYENLEILSKLIDGIYPDLNAKIPNHFKDELILEMDSKELSELIDRVLVIHNEIDNKIKIVITQDELIIDTDRKEIGSAIATTNNHGWKGDEFIIFFNAHYLKDAINKFNGNVQIKFKGKVDLFVIKGDSNENLLHLVLPYRSY